MFVFVCGFVRVVGGLCGCVFVCVFVCSLEYLIARVYDCAFVIVLIVYTFVCLCVFARAFD